jgi:O-antigen/teichoic acid export membrane protein
LFGALLTILFSSFLSQITFGSNNYAWAFSFLSLAVLFNQISTGRVILFRALMHSKIMMRTLIFGNFFGLVLTIPIYYLFGQKGIVPSLIIVEVASLFFALVFSLKLVTPKIKINLKDFTSISRKMLSLGLIVSLSGVITLAFNYVLRIFINNIGSVSEVGLYNAGFAVINTYVGMIFSAMATDYYPDLVAVSGNIDKERDLINQQAIIAILIISPIIIPFILFIKWFIYIFYSEQFLPINNMILFAAAGMIFKSLGWAFAFLFLARSSTKLYFWSELFFNIYMLAFNLIGYYFLGLTGLGLSFILAYVLYAMQVYCISSTIYKFKISSRLLYLFIVNLLFVLLALVLVFMMAGSIFFNLLAFTLFSFVLIYNLFWLDNLLGLRERFLL